MNDRYLIIGLGNIGKKHFANLAFLGADIDVVDEAYMDAAYYILNHPSLQKHACSISQAIYPLDSGYKGVLVCTPTFLRYDIIKQLKNYKCPIFIEKPLAGNYKEGKKIYNFAKKHKLKIFMGFPWRYHPCMLSIRAYLPKIGKIHSATSIGGSYLPGWHPEQDYRKSYSAKKNGGGITIDATHEFDLLLWLLGDFKFTRFIKANNSDLQIDSEDYCNVYIKHKNGASSSVIADYYRKARRREIEIVGENGTLVADLIKGTVHLKDDIASYLLYELPKDYNLMNMYSDQIKDFTKKKGVSIEDGLRVCKLLEDKNGKD